MKVSVLQDNLSKALSIAGAVTSSRSTLPILSNVKITTQDGSLFVQGTNLEVAVTCRVGAKVEEAGGTTLPAKLFDDYIKMLPPERIDMSLDKETETMQIDCGRFDSTIKGINIEDFPDIRQMNQDQDSFDIDGEVLSEMINLTVFAAANDESRPVLTGVYCQVEGDVLRMVSADGFRLSLKEIKLDKEPGDFGVIVPARALSNLEKIINQEKPDKVVIQLSKDNRQILFDTGDIQVVSQLVDGKFPDYKMIIPQNHTTQSILDQKAFHKAVKVGMLFAKESANVIKLKISENGIEMKAQSAELGDNESKINASVVGEPLSIGVNGRFLDNLLSALDGNQVSMKTTVESAPIRFEMVGDDSFIHIIMPMHLNR